jgi:microcompartment protein CcmK/EutM
VQVARVVGDVVATRKDPSLSSLTLLVLQPVDEQKRPAGRTLVAADAAGAGTGELVFFVRGREAAFPFYPVEPPVDAAIVGIVDHWSAEGTEGAEGAKGAEGGEGGEGGEGAEGGSR